MRARIRYLGLMRGITKRREDILQVDGASTVKDLLRALITKYGRRLEDGITTVDGGLRADVLLLVNGVSVARRKGLDTPLGEEEEEVTIALMNIAEGG